MSTAPRAVRRHGSSKISGSRGPFGVVFSLPVTCKMWPCAWHGLPWLRPPVWRASRSEKAYGTRSPARTRSTRRWGIAPSGTQNLFNIHYIH